jgi:hypothetical protein
MLQGKMMETQKSFFYSNSIDWSGCYEVEQKKNREEKEEDNK